MEDIMEKLIAEFQFYAMGKELMAAHLRDDGRWAGTMGIARKLCRTHGLPTDGPAYRMAMHGCREALANYEFPILVDQGGYRQHSS